LLALVDLTFDDCFAVRDIKLKPRTDNNELNIEFPKRRSTKLSNDGYFYAIAHPKTKEMYRYIKDTIIEAYNNRCENGNGQRV